MVVGPQKAELGIGAQHQFSDQGSIPIPLELDLVELQEFIPFLLHAFEIRTEPSKLQYLFRIGSVPDLPQAILGPVDILLELPKVLGTDQGDRKSTRLNS